MDRLERIAYEKGLEDAADLCDQHLDQFSATECTYRCDVAQAIRALKRSTPQGVPFEKP